MHSQWWGYNNSRNIIAYRISTFRFSLVQIQKRWHKGLRNKIEPRPVLWQLTFYSCNEEKPFVAIAPLHTQKHLHKPFLCKCIRATFNVLFNCSRAEKNSGFDASFPKNAKFLKMTCFALMIFEEQCVHVQTIFTSVVVVFIIISNVVAAVMQRKVELIC